MKILIIDHFIMLYFEKYFKRYIIDKMSKN